MQQEIPHADDRCLIISQYDAEGYLIFESVVHNVPAGEAVIASRVAAAFNAVGVHDATKIKNEVDGFLVQFYAATALAEQRSRQIAEAANDDGNKHHLNVIAEGDDCTTTANARDSAG